MSSNPTIAFIAKYAPPLGSSTPMPADYENAVYSKYHYDVYSIIRDQYPHLITGNDAKFIINNHNKIDYIFSLLNRAQYRNSEVFISALAEYYKIPYLGARPNIRALAEDKHLAKIMACYCGIHTPKWITADINGQIQDREPFSGPYFVKPRYGASSMHIDENSICTDWHEVKQRVNHLHNLGDDVIIEEFVDGIYFSSPVIMKENSAIILPAIREESSLKGNVVTYHQKRKVANGLRRSVEADSGIARIIENASQSIVEQIQPIDYTRIDYILSSTGTLNFLEFNVCCNLGIQSAFTLSAKSVGMSHSQLVLSILNESLRRQGII